MTEKQLDILSDLIATKVMKKLINKQQEWDEQFNEQLNQLSADDAINLTNTQERMAIEYEVSKLKGLRLSYISNEQYELLSDVEAKIVKLENALSKLQNNNTNNIFLIKK